MQRKYICKNGIVEVTRFPAGERARLRKWHRVKRPEAKMQDNARQAVRVTARQINNNFGPDDLFVEIGYSEDKWKKLFAGMDQDEIMLAAREEAAKLMRRLRRKQEIKYLYVTADMDGETGEAVRIHHHLILSGCSEEAVKKAWKNGGCHCEHLYRQDDYTPLAVYLHRQVRRIGREQLVCCSKNLEKCEIQEEVIESNPDTEIRVQPGAKVIDRTAYREGTVTQYVRYKRRKKPEKRGGHKKSAAEGGKDGGKDGV